MERLAADWRLRVKPRVGLGASRGQLGPALSGPAQTETAVD